MSDDVDFAMAESLAEDMFAELVIRIERTDTTFKTCLHAVMITALFVLARVPEDRRQAFCGEALAGIKEVIKAVLTPDSEYAAKARRDNPGGPGHQGLFKLVPKEPE